MVEIQELSLAKDGNLTMGTGTRGYRTRMGRVWIHFYIHG
jgi:hypothetical protein